MRGVKLFFRFVGLNFLNWSTELQLHYFDGKKAVDSEIKKEEQEELENPTITPWDGKDLPF